MKNNIIVLGKLKFDLRDPDEAYFAQNEIEAILDLKVEPVRTIPALFKKYPFNKLDDDIIHIMSRNLYLGEIQGYLAQTRYLEASKLILHPAFFKEFYLIIEDSKSLEQILADLNLEENTSLYQIFVKKYGDKKKIITIRLFPIQTLFEYGVEIKKLPEVVFDPKSYKNWDEYFRKKEKGIEECLEKMLEHLKNNHFRAPHFGLGKKHIGDFIDWASTELRKPFLHYLHKYKGKGDPRISRALINILKVKPGDTILDPFVGSGAFIADAPTMKLNAIGVEILEIGKMISEVKCNLNYNLSKLRREIVQLFNERENNKGLFKYSQEDDIKRLKLKLMKYSGGGRFYMNILPHLDKIIFLKNRIGKIKDEKIRKFLLVLLSQKIIEFAEKRRSNNFLNAFQNYVEDRYLVLYITNKLSDKLKIKLNEGEIKIIKGDSTRLEFLKDESIDGILTSPPYFDALDYVSNNKISLIILGFDDDLKFGSTKEFYNKTLALDMFFNKENIQLPQSSINLIELLQKNRRLIKANVVENYLKMMKLSFRECYRVLKKEKYYAMVISKYHSWIINKKEERIETSSIIADLGISEGFKLDRIIQHGISKADKGKINVEDILIFQK